MQITRLNGDRLFPWKMALLTSISHKFNPFEFKRSFHYSFMIFSKKRLTLSAITSLSRHCRIQLCELLLLLLLSLLFLLLLLSLLLFLLLLNLLVFNLFSSPLAGVPRAPATNGTTVTFIFHTFFSSLARSKYFSIFSTFTSYTLVSKGIAKSIIWHSWCSLSIKIMSGLLVIINWSVCTVKTKVLYKSHSQ